MSETNANPLLAGRGLPRYDLFDPGQVVPAIAQLIEELKAALAELERGMEPTWDGLMKPLENLDLPLSFAWGIAQHLNAVKNSDELREAYQKVQGDVVAADLMLKQSRPIYDGIKALREGSEWEKLDQAQRRAVEIRLRNAEQAGVGLDGAEKERFNEIERELSRMDTDFQNHVLDSTKEFELVVTDKADTEGWPENLRNLAAQSYNSANPKAETKATADEGPWRITLDYPSFVPFLQHSRNRVQREQVYRAHVSRASSGEHDNHDIVERELKLRREKAKLLGYKTYAELSLASKMAPSVPDVEKMFDEIFKAGEPHMRRDFEDLEELARENGETEALEPWDLGFWAERLSEKRFDFTDEQLRPYFPMPRVLDGLFSLSERLFGITIEPADGETSVWHEDVKFFKVKDENGQPMASFYLDAYSRPAEKRGGAWMNDSMRRRWIDGELELPAVILCCNGTPPVGNTPSLMSFNEVKTLFHEFGHGLQGMLTTVDHADVSGLEGVEWDAVELASQFMENWCYHRPTLMGMTAHYETGEQLPDDLFEKLCAARTYRVGSAFLRQLSFGMTDMWLHHQHDPDGDEKPIDVWKRVASKAAPLPPLPEDAFLCAFSHIFSGPYAAGYYSYLWAEVLSADAFAAFEDAGLDNETEVKRLGRRFRDTVLALGGGRHPMDIFRDFRGRKPSTAALLRHNGLDRSPA
ncbi:MAG: M3 family metallopeptidase [Candidatus Eisenbacteria bacterium]|nr:M3 family metallopeptidase [Candidatus Eisenbacteria bacterium]